MPAGRSRRHLAAAATTAGVLAVVLMPASGQAALTTFGSDLSAGADTSEARQADTAYWQTAFADGRSVTAPASGQIRSVKIKGIALSDRTTGSSPPGGERDFHIQVAQPQSNGTLQIRNPGGTSGNFVLPPQSANPQGITEYLPENLCVRAGDVVVFNTVGGFDPTGVGPFAMGTPLQIFARVPGAVTSGYTSADHTNNGDTLTPDTSRGASHELLMQVTVGSGADGTGLCPGGGSSSAPPPPPPPPPGSGGSPKAPQKATLSAQKVSVSSKGKLSVSLFCHAGTSSCAGTLRVLSRNKKPVTLGSKTFTIANKKTGHVTVHLNKTGRKRFTVGHGRLAVKLVAVTKPGGATRTSSLSVTLRKRGG